MTYIEALCPSRARAAVVTYFVTDGAPITVTGLSKRIGMNSKNVAQLMPDLLKKKLVKTSGKTAQGQFYWVNENYPNLRELRIIARTPLIKKRDETL